MVKVVPLVPSVRGDKQNINVFLSGNSETLSMFMLLTQYKHQTTLGCNTLHVCCWQTQTANASIDCYRCLIDLQET